MRLEITGIEEVNKILKEIAPKHAANIARSTVHAIASDIAKEAKSSAVTGDTKNLKKSIKAKRRKSPSYRPRSDVVVTHGSSAKNDAWYWHFVEFGTKKQPAQPFFLPVYNKYKASINTIYKKKFFVQLAKKLAREAKKNGV